MLGVGVNSGHVFLTSGRLLGRLLFQRILRMGPAYAGYRDPLAIGLVPLPLPFSLAVNLPLPCRLRYVVGEPVYGAPIETGAESKVAIDSEAAVRDLAGRAAQAMERLLAEHGRPGSSYS